MALDKCVECGKAVAELAKACPHCGAREPGEKLQNAKTIGCAVIIGLVLISAL